MGSNLPVGAKAKGGVNTGACVWVGQARSPQAGPGLRRVVKVRYSHGGRSGSLVQDD